MSRYPFVRLDRMIGVLYVILLVATIVMLVGVAVALAMGWRP